MLVEIDFIRQELRELFVVAVDTGLRKGDLRDLRWNQVDLAEGFISPSGVVAYIRGPA